MNSIGAVGNNPYGALAANYQPNQPRPEAAGTLAFEKTETSGTLASGGPGSTFNAIA